MSPSPAHASNRPPSLPQSQENTRLSCQITDEIMMTEQDNNSDDCLRQLNNAMNTLLDRNAINTLMAATEELRKRLEQLEDPKKKNDTTATTTSETINNTQLKPKTFAEVIGRNQITPTTNLRMQHPLPAPPNNVIHLKEVMC
ncbi:hypothetical protein O181_065905 [Austropuccinia psidii MF-1]|uniref:Uncharacterized protein n=1 Tax=Austropuccinia psidii MF-1 TaxID=1389203 RepID=A0A9Q3EW11_9BASI|nr:hypothetical protein [Austropuccinia psidii MF-1]